MCIATGPTQYIWTITEKREGKDDWVRGYWSREDWAKDCVERWSKLHPKSKFLIEKHQLDWWMRCH